MRRCALPALLLAALALSGCPARQPAVPSAAPSVAAGPEALFEDVTQRAGIRFVHASGATGKFLYIENTPPGVAFLDFDNDGFLDLFFVQSGPSDPPQSVKDRPHCALYKNNGDGTFSDITAGSGFDKDLGHAQGVAVADVDNDGFDDVLVTGYNACRLFRNERGAGKFVEITKAAGLAAVRGYATSAAFGDIDNDGRLDLYICRYSPWDWQRNIRCADTIGVDYCTPEVYDPEEHYLFRNEGRAFRDISVASGIRQAKGRGLGAAFLDYDDDGHQDIFVANDITPNMLWRNNGNNTFKNVAVEAGCAYDTTGKVMAGMGIAVGDYDRSGRQSLYVGNFSDKPNMLYRNVGHGLFEEASFASGLALPHMKFLTFGTEFLDYDADGWPDLFVVNGHVQTHADQKMEGIAYKERKQLFRNKGDGTFEEIVDPARLGALMHATVGRGLAIGDFDNDGRVDALVGNQNDAPELLRNRLDNGNHWVSFQTRGTRSNREGRHARFTLKAGGATQTAVVPAGSSYLSSSSRRVYFGLGKAATIDSVEVRWPSGAKDILKNVAPDALYLVTEGKGVTGTLPRKRG